MLCSRSWNNSLSILYSQFSMVRPAVNLRTFISQLYLYASLQALFCTVLHSRSWYYNSLSILYSYVSSLRPVINLCTFMHLSASSAVYWGFVLCFNASLQVLIYTTTLFPSSPSFQCFPSGLDRYYNSLSILLHPKTCHCTPDLSYCIWTLLYWFCHSVYHASPFTSFRSSRCVVAGAVRVCQHSSVL